MEHIIRVAVPIPHRHLFDYKCDAAVEIGSRVLVKFGRRRLVGMVVEHAQHSEMPADRIHKIEKILDPKPAIPEQLLKTIRWTADYYHQSIGEMLWTALPASLRHGRPVQPKLQIGWRLTDAGLNTELSDMKRAPVQHKLISLLKANNDRPTKSEVLKQAGSSWRSAIKTLISKELVAEVPLEMVSEISGTNLLDDLTTSQIAACEEIISKSDEYYCFLIQGVTGSGKTEVYLQAIAKVLESGGQALMLVPEIGLSPQLEQRVRSALGTQVATYHSGHTPFQQHRTWWQAYTGRVKIVIGTRSAVFLAFKNLKMIVIDEEHDSSFKQQERVRYHARTVAIHRAMTGKFPLIFGTATPSLETIHAARKGRAKTLVLPERATRVAMPHLNLMDLSNTLTHQGVAINLIDQIQSRIEQSEQSLIFINRRGFAPVTVCLDCKWTAMCENCDTKLIFHANDGMLHCHRCMERFENFLECPECLSIRLQRIGEGTQRIEQAIQSAIPGARVVRIDRDTTRSYTEFERKLHRIQRGEVDVLIGTQMLSKGHHFPRVTLVGILNIDQCFYSMDFRAMEHMVQQVLQVAGRAGRVDKAGEVYIQTLHPQSEYFHWIRDHNYLGFTLNELKQREAAGHPPYTHYALLQASSIKSGEEIVFLETARQHATEVLEQMRLSSVQVFDIVQSPIQRISKRYRAQLLVSGDSVLQLKSFLAEWMPYLDKIRKRHQLRWAVDVDPIDFS